MVIEQIAPFVSNLDNAYTQQYVDELIKGYSAEYDIRLLVIDTQGVVRVDAYNDLIGTKLEVTEIARALLGERSAEIYTYDQEYVMYAGLPIVDHNSTLGALFISASVDDMLTEVERIMERLLVIFSISVLVSIFVSMIFARIVSKPIEKLTDSVRHITMGKYDTKVEITGKDEIGALGNAFNLMTTKLFQVEERRKKFVSNVSHELRTPMTSMKIVSDTLLSTPHWDESVYREFLQDINAEIDRLNNIIDSLLYLVRIEKDDLELNYSMTYVNYLLEWVIKTIMPIAKKKGIQVTLETSSKVQFLLDQEKMQQCLLNIIGNAVKYTQEGGSVKVALSEFKTDILIQISDNGMGIPAKDVPFLFDRFYRVDEARVRKTGGTGLGLSIAQQIVQLHQGEINVESEEGEGTTVSIILPKK